MKDRGSLIQELRSYKAFDSNEELYRCRMLELLDKEQLCFSRDLLHAHFTASCFVVSNDHKSVLLLHHKKLSKWLQPGGHCDGNENLVEVAQKELWEETGIKAEPYPFLFDLDIHVIPEHKLTPTHEHFDVRLLFSIKKDTQMLKNEESNALKWVDFDQLIDYTQEKSIDRMVQKIIRGQFSPCD